MLSTAQVIAEKKRPPAFVAYGLMHQLPKYIEFQMLSTAQDNKQKGAHALVTYDLMH